MTVPIRKPSTVDRIAVVPLMGNQPEEEAYWLGALLARLLADHLSAAGLSPLPYRTVAEQIRKLRLMLPFNEETRLSFRAATGVWGIVDGRYVLDNEGKMLAMRLMIDAPGVSSAPLHSSAPLNAFSSYVERVSLAIVERLGTEIDEELRQRAKSVQRPTNFEAFRQLAQAQAAWNRDQKELALAAVHSALLFQPDYEDATAIEVAIAREANDVKTALDAFRRWATIAEKDNRQQEAATRLMQLGHWLNERGEWPEARKAYEDARNLLRKLDDEPGVARALNNIASLELQGGKLHDAIRAYRRSLRFFEESPEDRRDAAVTLANLALAHKNLGQRAEALVAIEQALDLTRQFNDPRLQGHCLAQRGAIHDDMGEWAQAEADYQQASRLLDVAHDDLNRAIVTGHRALLHKQQGHYQQAERLLLEAQTALDKLHYPHEQAVLSLNLADLYLAMELYSQAWRYARQAHETFSRLKSGWTAQAQELLDMLDSPSTDRETPLEDEEEDAMDLLAPLSPDEGITIHSRDEASQPFSGIEGYGRPVSSGSESPEDDQPDLPGRIGNI